MGERNYLIEGVSCTGKTTVCRELQRRGYHAINGDTELAYRGDPLTGDPVVEDLHKNHIWDVSKVRAMVADKSHAATFFCGGSRNFAAFIGLFDRVFILDIDLETLNRRLAARPESDWGGREAERRIVRRLHVTKEDIPRDGVLIDATAPLEHVLAQILQKL